MLDKIVFFLYVVRHSSFSEAARQYGISTSAGSRWISELEAKMGVSLLKRTTRKVIPTQAGLRLYDRFDLLNHEINDIFSEIQNFSAQTRGLIKIAATPLFAQDYLAMIIGEFLIKYPEVSFKIIESPFEVDLIEDIDFSVRAAANYVGYQEKDSLLIKRVLMKDPLITCCSPAYIMRLSEPLHPSELHKHNCLYATTLVGGNRWVYEYNKETIIMEIAQTVEADNSVILKTIALNGGGIAYLPRSLVKDDIANGRLKAILVDYQTSYFEFSLYYRPRKQMPMRHQNFKSYLIQRVKEMSEIK